ncbi:MAG TPA: hypothetical protein VGO91_07130 [Pyrinomonadaceae bacterium]|nr:hypothetical protein [Pyrinomonadaceae bacterium]
MANLTLGILPRPDIPESMAESIDPRLGEKILNELRVHLRLKRNDNSPRALGKLYGALSEEMAKLALKGVDLNVVKARLGQQGSLSPSQYVIKFTVTFVRFGEKCGISRQQVESALRKPDAVEHLRPEHFGFDLEKATSLFLKTQTTTSAPSGLYHLLILTDRHGYTLDVLNAWRVYPSDVDLSTATTPLDVFRAFVETFGTTFRIGDKEKKLFMYEKLPIQTDEEMVKINTLQGVERLIQGQVVGQFNNEMFEVVISYQIDYANYTESLRKHGLKVTAITRGKFKANARIYEK